MFPVFLMKAFTGGLFIAGHSPIPPKSLEGWCLRQHTLIQQKMFKKKKVGAGLIKARPPT